VADGGLGTRGPDAGTTTGRPRRRRRSASSSHPRRVSFTEPRRTRS